MISALRILSVGLVFPVLLSGCGSGVKADPKARAAAEWALRQGGAVRVVDQPGMVRQVGQLPGGAFGLEAIDLNERDPNLPPVGDQDLRSIEGLTNIRKLSLYGANITDKGAETIAELKSLRELELSQTQITDKGLESLSKLPNLEKLFIRNVGDKVSDDAVKQFRNRTDAEVFQ